MKKKILFYSGSGNHPLFARILNYLKEYLGQELSFNHVDGGEFPDEEPDDQIPDFENVAGKPVVFFQSIFDRALFEEALELIWGLKKQYGATYLIAVIPFLIFRRQDHDEKSEEICRLKMAIDRLKHAGVDEIITVSPHSPKMAEFCQTYGVKFWEVDPSPLFAATIKTYLSGAKTIYSPDNGSISRAVDLAKIIGCRVIFSLKERGLNNEAAIKPEESEEIAKIINYYKTKKNFSEIYYADASHINGEQIVMVEDEAATCQTANQTGRRLKNLGAKVLIFIAVHPVLVRGWKRKLFFLNPFDKIILGDTIPRGYKKRTGGRIHDISVADLLAQALYKSIQHLVA